MRHQPNGSGDGKGFPSLNETIASFFRQAGAVAIGKGASGSAYKTIYAIRFGQITLGANSSKGVGYGKWMSTDNGANWTRSSQFFDGCFGEISDMAGDPSRFGRVYFAHRGFGLQKMDYVYNLRAT